MPKIRNIRSIGIEQVGGVYFFNYEEDSPPEGHFRVETLYTALSAGTARLPVVATCDNGTAEQITDGETGLFVPSENPEAAAAAIIHLLNDEVLRRKLGENLFRKVNDEYSTTVVIPRWQALFEELAACKVTQQVGQSAPRNAHLL